MTLENPNLEGYNIVRNLWIKYYKKSAGNFIAPEKCSGCYNNEKFVVWAVSVAVQSVVDGARIYKELVPLIDPAIDTFQRYKNPHLKGFSAAENNGSDKDIYYDDDAQVCSAMLTAYEVTGNLKYLDQGRELTRFLMGGWNDNPNAKNKGGMKWHLNNAYLNTCTTAETAKCCLQIAKFIPNEEKVYLDFAIKCTDWLVNTLQDPSDKLFWDGIQDTSDKHNDAKWSYNAGTPLSCAAHLYHYTKDEKWKKIATDIAKSAINRNSIIYDRDYDMDKRYWRDSSYFVQLLIEGLADYMLYIGNEDGLADDITEEIKRHLVMFYEYMRDPNDGLYIQSFEPHRTYRDVYDKKYKPKFGDRKGWSLKDEDKSGDKPMKCLMGCGSAARVFFQGARVVPKID
ncbi:putative meiotically up-regulated gene 191 protein [[Candida] jaroonii]|uniref:Meiotically up-regulated gene 191 protein n=1 Tax=[Candida] jaroonii TaxID=467808 RepID=A0ACA9Y4M8_9ASCO|nr:putative meiotically up-regulated gene 191 protein [[Candida] jaroonii]